MHVLPYRHFSQTLIRAESEQHDMTTYAPCCRLPLIRHTQHELRTCYLCSCCILLLHSQLLSLSPLSSDSLSRLLSLSSLRSVLLSVVLAGPSHIMQLCATLGSDLKSFTSLSPLRPFAVWLTMQI